ncbi:MAG: hypothetical protein EHM40_08005 [Chloroflexi bacterium]|nr:MAG: hypothetical protein EHM40_08005 [Chloroflexota bacterium]
MRSESPVKFAVYNLRNSFSKEPGDIHYCLDCGSLLLKFNILPSATIIDDLLRHSGVSYDYSHLDKCPSCGWWAIRESWLDIGANGWHDFLIVGECIKENGLETMNQPHSFWSRVLQNKNIYSGPAQPLPAILRQKITGEQEELINLFEVGAKVRLLTDIRVRQPIGTGSPLCMQGSQGAVVQSAKYLAQYKQELEKWRKSENMIDEKIKLALLREAAGALESGVCCAVQLESLGSSALNESGKDDICKVGKIYLLESASLERIQ